MVPLEALRAKFPWARFLAEGGFKQVYMVFNAEMQRSEAVSVMDMAAMEELGNVAVADSEVQLSLLPSMFSLSLCLSLSHTHVHTHTHTHTGTAVVSVVKARPAPPLPALCTSLSVPADLPTPAGRMGQCRQQGTKRTAQHVFADVGRGRRGTKESG